MKLNKETAFKVWEYEHGCAEYAEDFAGNYMCKNAFGKRNYYEKNNGTKIYCGWNLHHILPKACGGSNKFVNLTCTNIITNDLAQDKTTFNIDDCIYQVKKTFGHREHEIFKLN